MFPKTGKRFPKEGGFASSTYATLIAEVLKSELAGSHQAHKTLMRWTGANEKTTKNWLCGSNGPSGEHLLQLMRHSDRVYEFVLRLSQRPVMLSNRRLAELRDSLRGTVNLLSEAIELQDKGPSERVSCVERDDPRGAASSRLSSR